MSSQYDTLAADPNLRICTLLPSATEIAYLLGLGANVVGVTHECDYPDDVQSKRRVVHSRIDTDADSGTIDAQVRSFLASGQSVYELDVEAMTELNPDLIITQGLCEVCALPYDDVASVAKQMDSEPDIVSLNPTSLNDVFDDIIRVGEAAGVVDATRTKVAELQRRVDSVCERVKDLQVRKVVCLEWLDPLMVGGHWVPEMVELAGGHDVLAIPGEPTRRVSVSEVVESGPEVILLMPCGYDVGSVVKESETSCAISQLLADAALRSCAVYAVDANAYFSRSGPRLVDGVELMSTLFHPELMDASRQVWAVKLS